MVSTIYFKGNKKINLPALLDFSNLLKIQAYSLTQPMYQYVVLNGYIYWKGNEHINLPALIVSSAQIVSSFWGWSIHNGWGASQPRCLQSRRWGCLLWRGRAAEAAAAAAARDKAREEPLRHLSFSGQQQYHFQKASFIFFIYIYIYIWYGIYRATMASLSQ